MALAPEKHRMPAGRARLGGGEIPEPGEVDHAPLEEGRGTPGDWRWVSVQLRGEAHLCVGTKGSHSLGHPPFPLRALLTSGHVLGTPRDARADLSRGGQPDGMYSVGMFLKCRAVGRWEDRCSTLTVGPHRLPPPRQGHQAGSQVCASERCRGGLGVAFRIAWLQGTKRSPALLP